MAPNHLINEKSPYLQQHAHNPVDWHPWSEETFARARRENKPVFLSIGYATCHWCHVMEKESFEDEEVARHLNDTFVSIKVDREERPDIDAVYMAACQMLTGAGGWPLNLFITPEKKPFFAATYIPKGDRFGQPGLIQLCQKIKGVWESEADKVNESASSIAAAMDKAFTFSPANEPDESLLEEAYNRIKRAFDPRSGGFEAAPKFPTPHRLLFLLRRHYLTGDPFALEMVEKTLNGMRLGGIWDHVGFGFHRYSTDKDWLVPHFEKMLYDQALIAIAYLETYQISKNPIFARTANEIFTYVLRDMTSEDGAFFSAEDADSEGEEGKFYVWNQVEFSRVLDEEDAELWKSILRLSPEGNFSDEAAGHKTGANIIHLTAPLDKWAEKLGVEEDELQRKFDRVREKLFKAREKRIHVLKDDKILTDWNGLMIAALALGARVLNRPEYASAAERAAQFILKNLCHDKGQLFHRFRDGELAIRGQAGDYAFFIYGLISLYQATFDLSYAEKALALQKKMIEDFWDEEKGGFFSTPTGHEELPVRPKELYDGALPSANSVSLLNLLCLSRLTGEPEWDKRAQDLVRAFSGTVKAQPAAFTFFLLGLDFALHPGQDIVIAGEPDTTDTRALLAALNLNFSPGKVALVKSDHNAERLAKFAGFTDGLQVVRGQSRAHICQGGACTGTTTDTETMLSRLFDK